MWDRLGIEMLITGVVQKLNVVCPLFLFCIKKLDRIRNRSLLRLNYAWLQSKSKLQSGRTLNYSSKYSELLLKQSNVVHPLFTLVKEKQAKMKDLQNICPYCFHPVDQYGSKYFTFLEKCNYCEKYFMRNQTGLTIKLKDQLTNVIFCLVVILISFIALWYNSKH